MLFSHDSDNRFRQIVAEQAKKQEAEEAKEAKKRMEQEAEEAKTRMEQESEEAKLKSTYMYQLQNLGKRVYGALPSRNDVYNSFTPLIHIPASGLHSYFRPYARSEDSALQPYASREVASSGDASHGVAIREVNSFLDSLAEIDYYEDVQVPQIQQVAYQAELAEFENIRTFEPIYKRRYDDKGVQRPKEVYFVASDATAEENQKYVDNSKEIDKLYEIGKNIIRLKYFMDDCMMSYRESQYSGDVRTINEGRKIFTINLMKFYLQLYRLTGGIYYLEGQTDYRCVPVEFVIMAVLISQNDDNDYLVGYYNRKYNSIMRTFASFSIAEKDDSALKTILQEEIPKIYPKFEHLLTMTCMNMTKISPVFVTNLVYRNMQNFIGSYDYYDANPSQRKKILYYLTRSDLISKMMGEMFDLSIRNTVRRHQNAEKASRSVWQDQEVRRRLIEEEKERLHRIAKKKESRGGKSKKQLKSKKQRKSKKQKKSKKSRK